MSKDDLDLIGLPLFNAEPPEPPNGNGNGNGHHVSDEPASAVTVVERLAAEDRFSLPWVAEAALGDTVTPDQRKVDYEAVGVIRERVANRRSADSTDASNPVQLDRETALRLITEEVDTLIEDELHTRGLSYSHRERASLLQAVQDSIFGLGRLQPLLDDDSIENIEIRGHDRVIVERTGGRLEMVDPIADSDEQLLDDLTYLASNGHDGHTRDFSYASPTMHMRLPDGSRLAASRSPVSDRPLATIRRHRLVDTSLEDLQERGMLSGEARQLVEAIQAAEFNVMVTGTQGVGKTTFMRACCNCYDPWLAVGTIETEYELYLHRMAHKHYRVVAKEEAPGSGEIGRDGRRTGQVTLDDLAKDMMRHNLDRLLLGEVRGDEARTLMKVLPSVKAAMWTVHGATGMRAVDRMVQLIIDASRNSSVGLARHMLASNVDFILHLDVTLERDADGNRRRHRYLSEILEVTPGEEGPAFSRLFGVTDRSYVAHPTGNLTPERRERLAAFSDYVPPVILGGGL